MGRKTTLSAIKADVGGFPGHANTHKDLMDAARETLEEQGDVLDDFRVTHIGDDINLILTHQEGEDSEKVHQLAWDAFQNATEVAEDLKLDEFTPDERSE
ncbi:MAG: fructose 1,6-bisphosphatase, partial [Candidatus Nanohaloarchaea archaeon]|nr:fructose 1,6-bisphosphatase [Candidatus Nanohaloarchaea archaeon]